VVEAALGVYVEARRLLFVKGAEPHEASSSLRQLDALTDYFDDVRVASHSVERLLSDHEATIRRRGALAQTAPVG
jgi:hypothetical protein